MEPLTWVYLALLAASTAASAKAQQKTNKARAHVAAEDRERRKEQQKEQEAAAMRTQEEYFNQTGKTAEREAELARQFATQAPAAPTTDAGGTRFLDTAAPTSSTETIEGIKGEQAKGAARASQRATSMAQLGAFGDVLRDANLAASRNAQDIGLSASKMQGWTNNVLPALYAKANLAGRDWATTADVMKLAAAVMSYGALSGGGSAATKAFDTSTVAPGAGSMGIMPGEWDWLEMMQKMQKSPISFNPTGVVLG
jgi:hypothetical protein